MRLLPRRLLKLASAASLILCVAVGLLWVRSYRTWDQATWRTQSGGEFEARSASGVIELAAATGLTGENAYRFIHSEPVPEPFDWSRVPDDVFGAITDEMAFWSDYVWISTWQWECAPLGLFASRARYIDDSESAANRLTARMPHWILLVVLILLPAVTIARLARGRLRQKRGLCEACGYDLRASLHGCPECGEGRQSL